MVLPVGVSIASGEPIVSEWSSAYWSSTNAPVVPSCSGTVFEPLRPRDVDDLRQALVDAGDEDGLAADLGLAGAHLGHRRDAGCGRDGVWRPCS